jgi:LacI family transcriptional regulator
MPLHPRSARHPTQNDVARVACVSRGTVSYVLNGQADGKVVISPETRARVWAAIEQLGYVPDAGARALRSGATHTIGLIIPDLRNPHFWENADGVEQEARAAGYRILLSSMDLSARYGEDVFKDLSGRRIDALILTGSLVDQSPEAEQIMARSLKRGLPIVEIHDRRRDDPAVDCVISDYRPAAAAVMEHLLALGHRRIGLVYGVAQPVLALDRLEPYREALAAAGLPADPALVVECGPEIEHGYQAALQLLALPNRPTAIVAVNDLLAMAALRAAGDCGLRVPEELSLVGYDDIPQARFLVPRLTTASKDAVRLGREAVRLALSRLREPQQPRQIVTIPARFIIRESTAPAPRAALQPAPGAGTSGSHKMTQAQGGKSTHKRPPASGDPPAGTSPSGRSHPSRRKS